MRKTPCFFFMKGWMFMKCRLIRVMLSAILICAICILLPGFSGNCASGAVKKAKMNVKKLTLTKNDTYTLRVYNLKKKYSVRFASDNEAVVSVSVPSSRSKSAQVTAVNVGATTVRAQVYNKKAKLVRTLKTTIKVTPYAISIKFQQKKVKLNLNDSMKLPIIIKPNTSQEVPLYQSSDPDVITVNSKGIITAIAPGNAVITATLLSNGQKASCKVTVIPFESPEPSSSEPPERTPNYSE